jgi:hypothetical protein
MYPVENVVIVVLEVVVAYTVEVMLVVVVAGLTPRNVEHKELPLWVFNALMESRLRQYKNLVVVSDE